MRKLKDENTRGKYLLFLDGDHSYETVTRELALVSEFSDVAVLLHDTFYQPNSQYNHGPYLAICDFVAKYECAQVVQLQTGLPGMTYLHYVRKEKQV